LAKLTYVVVYGAFFTPGQVREKNAFSVSWTIENLGGAQLESFDVELFLDDVKEGNSKTVPKLDASKSTPVTWVITKELPSGIHKVELKTGGGSIGFTQFDVIP
jgi:subtilase family serine protease